MAAESAFRPSPGDKNHLFSVTTSASNPGVRLTGAPGASTMSLRILNSGSNPAYFSAAPAAATLAVVPTAGSPANGIRVPAGAAEVFTVPANAYLSFISTGGTTTLEINIGEGI